MTTYAGASSELSNSSPSFSAPRTAGYGGNAVNGDVGRLIGDGYDLGYAAGEAAGYADGYAAGLTDGYADGYAAGDTAGQATGYAAGYDVGYDAGYAAALSGIEEVKPTEDETPAASTELASVDTPLVLDFGDDNPLALVVVTRVTYDSNGDENGQELVYWRGEFTQPYAARSTSEEEPEPGVLLRLSILHEGPWPTGLPLELRTAAVDRYGNLTDP